MNLEKAIQVIKNASETVEQFPIVFLVAKAKEIALKYPNDPTAVGMYQFLSEKNRSGKLLISKAEFTKVYNTLYTNNTKFGSFFEKELIKPELPKPVMASPRSNIDLRKEALNLVDKNILDGIGAIFGNNEYKTYTVQSVEQAKKNCKVSIESFGLKASAIDIAVGNENILLCNASFDTPKGTTSIIFPVEVIKNQAILPNLFLSENGFFNLTGNNLKEQLNLCAGKKLSHSLNNVLKVYSTMKNGLPEKVSEVKLALLKTKLEADKPTLENPIIGQKFAQHTLPVQNPVRLTKEEKSISDKMASPLGQAEFLFGKHNVETSHKWLSFELKNAGVSDFRIKMASVEKNKIYYDVMIGVKTFKVPMKIANNKVSAPEIIISEGSISEFSSENIAKIASSNSKTIAEFSPLYELSSENLLSTIKMAMLSNDRQKAEDALNVLKEKDPQNYVLGFNEYMNGTKLKKSEKTCSKPIKIASRAGWVCSHTMLPLSEVCQDEVGDCVPLWRKKIAAPEVGSFMANKIVLE